MHKNNCSYGEENGWRCKEKFADYVWVLDPIDGTKSFITGIFLLFDPFFFIPLYSSRIIGSTSKLCNLHLFIFVPFPGKPLFGTLIALLHKGRPVRITFLVVGYFK